MSSLCFCRRFFFFCGRINFIGSQFNRINLFLSVKILPQIVKENRKNHTKKRFFYSLAYAFNFKVADRSRRNKRVPTKKAEVTENLPQKAEIKEELPEETQGFKKLFFIALTSQALASSSEEVALFMKIKEAVSAHQYIDFLKCASLFSQDIINKSELVTLVKEMLTPHPSLLEMFKQFLDYVEPPPRPGNFFTL